MSNANALLNELFRQIEQENCVVQYLYANVETLRALRDIDGGDSSFMGDSWSDAGGPNDFLPSYMWTAQCIIDETLPFGEVVVTDDPIPSEYPMGVLSEDVETCISAMGKFTDTAKAGRESLRREALQKQMLADEEGACKGQVEDWLYLRNKQVETASPAGSLRTWDDAVGAMRQQRVAY
jgi:hypothetical protein